MQDTSTGFNLITKRVRDDRVRNEVLSRDANLNDAEFKDTGRLFLVPNITAEEEAQLRSGLRITADKTAKVKFHFRFKNVKGEWEWKAGEVTVTAKDYESTGQEVFFGDRPMDNPGYSVLKLEGSVAVNQINDRLDVYKVEQRLRYLGFPAFGAAPTNSIAPIDFAVDGSFGDNESRALKLFEKVIRYNYSGDSTKFAPVTAGADGSLRDTSVRNSEGEMTLDWLNAWNAPHWMNVGQYSERHNPHVVNSQDNSGDDRREVYGTSWIGDWLVAQQYVPLAGNYQSASGSTPYVPYQLLFNGGVDENLATTPGQHKSHDLGMAFDIGIRPRTVNGVTINAPISRDVSERNVASDRMPQLTSPVGLTLGQWSDAAAAWFQPDTRNEYKQRRIYGCARPFQRIRGGSASQSQRSARAVEHRVRWTRTKLQPKHNCFR